MNNEVTFLNTFKIIKVGRPFNFNKYICNLGLPRDPPRSTRLLQLTVKEHDGITLLTLRSIIDIDVFNQI
jgi:hypothetical protein